MAFEVCLESLNCDQKFDSYLETLLQNSTYLSIVMKHGIKGEAHFKRACDSFTLEQSSILVDAEESSPIFNTYLGGVVERSDFGHFMLYSWIVGKFCERSTC